jgi:hypothetical protein
LNNNEYKLLAKTLNRLVERYKHKIDLLCHNSIHLIREHPIFLSKYESIFTYNFIKFTLFCFYRFIYGFFSLFYSLKNFYQDNKMSKSANTEDDLLFISHFLNKSILGKEDFYYGKLPDYLTGKNTILYINHQNKWFKNLNDHWSSSKANRVLLSKNTNIINELILITKILLGFFRYILNIFISKNYIDFKINFFLTLTYFSNSSLFNLRMYHQFSYYFKKVSVKTVIFTFEGHAWEKLLVLAARKAGVKKIIAYQHANISEFQNSIFKFHGIYKVDHVLSSNMHGFEKLSKVYNNVKLVGSLRVNKKTSVNNFRSFLKKRHFTCLVVPDGILSECINLFSYTLESARLNKNINFIWRLHPLITFDMVKKRINFNSLPKNIILSHNPIEKDIDHSSWVVYRASTAVLPAALSGLRPVFFPQNDNLQIDPLYFLDKKWKKFCSDPIMLNKIFNKDIECNFRDHLNNKYLKKLNSKFNQSFNLNNLKRVLIEAN